MNQQAARFIPSSLLRIRCFLGNGGMSVKPWATGGETLDALHDLVASKKDDDEFWKSLASLLGRLTDDMKKRARAKDDSIINNEALDPARHRLLLSEIRQKLDGRRIGRGRFHALASALSMPALGLLLVLGGAVTAGCYSSAGSENDDATADTSSDDAGEDRLHDPVIDPAPDPRPDPVTDPAEDPAQEDIQCAHAGETLEQILLECLSTEGERNRYLNCINLLHESWNTGLRDLFDCESCAQINEQLMFCLSERCYDPASQGEFNLEEFLDNCFMPVYIGVRYE